jgi:hypothetical protein
MVAQDRIVCELRRAVPISAGELVDLAELIDESVAALEAAPPVTPEGQTKAMRRLRETLSDIASGSLASSHFARQEASAAIKAADRLVAERNSHETSNT